MLNLTKNEMLLWMESTNWKIRAVAVANCNGDKDILMMGIKDEEWTVRRAAVENCNGDKDILMLGIKNCDIDVRISAAECCNGDKDILMMAIKDKDWAVRVAAVENCNGDKDILMLGIKDCDIDVRIAAISNCDGDKDILMRAIKDEEWTVRIAAIRKAEINDAKIEDKPPILRTFEPPKKVYKKCINGVIVVAEIPKDAFVRGRPYTKCRASKAKIIDVLGDIYGKKIGISRYDFKTTYEIGDTIEIENFDFSDTDCSTGFHFFCTIKEASNYYI